MNLFPLFLIGLLGGVHCAGMCGGIVGALSLAGLTRRIPIAVAGGQGTLAQPALGQASFALAYHAGRLSSYAAAGALAGGMAGSLRMLPALASFQSGLYLLANLMLVLLGLSLMNAFSGLSRLEKLGGMLWRRLQPLTRQVLPADTLPKALLLGLLWGWVPCGMVYSVLATAMLAGSSVDGAAVMLAFGAGTLPLMLSMSLAGEGLRGWLQRPRVRLAGGALVLLFGLLGWARAAHGLPADWLADLCLSPAHPVSHVAGPR